MIADATPDPRLEVTVRLTADQVDQLDALAASANVSRNAVLVWAVRAALGEAHARGLLRELRRGRLGGE